MHAACRGANVSRVLPDTRVIRGLGAAISCVSAFLRSLKSFRGLVLTDLPGFRADMLRVTLDSKALRHPSAQRALPTSEVRPDWWLVHG